MVLRKSRKRSVGLFFFIGSIVDNTNYVRINDYTCDIDVPEDAVKFEAII